MQGNEENEPDPNFYDTRLNPPVLWKVHYENLLADRHDDAEIIAAAAAVYDAWRDGQAMDELMAALGTLVYGPQQ